MTRPPRAGSPLDTARGRRRGGSVLARFALGAALGALVGCGGGDDGGPSWRTTGGVDFAVDAASIVESIAFEDRFFGAGHCALEEGSVGAEGMRRLLLFDTVMVNHGEQDAVMGPPTNPVPPLVPGDFEFSPCHGHHHFTGWAEYVLEDLGGNPVAFGHKQAFCLLDSIPWFGTRSSGFTCSFQGLSSGWADVYDASLDGQWVDVTGVPEGDYRLRVSINVAGRIPENDVRPNTAVVPVRVPDPNDPQ